MYTHLFVFVFVCLGGSVECIGVHCSKISLTMDLLPVFPPLFTATTLNVFYTVYLRL